MISKVDICNIALQLLGSRKITSFEDGTVESRLCKDQYPISKAFLLRAHPWNFAIKRVSLPPLADAPPFEWAYQFEKPGDFILLLEVTNLTVNEYIFEGNKILADVNALNIRYVSDIIDSSLFEADFVNILAHHLVINLFESLDGTVSKKEKHQKRFDKLLSDAKMTDGRENPITQIQESSWLAARR